ncbi:hypothetical protein NA57DRAFT_75679 [Rhizodiscina lignyota]|uniref:Uncharacterized protein n=1 Tax=Rhizodiscina lignyota TaxID=1504668 RepID=A0A9P4IEA8_9PEZI|nr:hypothetical protein NA57DRAFT_75679 [Rhizodiscina lignyota]
MWWQDTSTVQPTLPILELITVQPATFPSFRVARTGQTCGNEDLPSAINEHGDLDHPIGGADEVHRKVPRAVIDTVSTEASDSRAVHFQHNQDESKPSDPLFIRQDETQDRFTPILPSDLGHSMSEADETHPKVPQAYISSDRVSSSSSSREADEARGRAKIREKCPARTAASHAEDPATQSNELIRHDAKGAGAAQHGHPAAMMPQMFDFINQFASNALATQTQAMQQMQQMQQGQTQALKQ